MLKNRLIGALQKLLGLRNYLVLFTRWRIWRLPFDKRRKTYRAFVHFIQPDFNVAVIGACTGITTVPLAKRAALGNVFAYEPTAQNFSALQRVIDWYRLKNVQLKKIALGNSTGTITLIYPRYQGAWKQGLAHVKHDSIKKFNTGEKEEVEVRRLDDELKDERIDAMKIIAENFEAFILEGGTELIKKNRPLLYFDLWENENRERVFQLLQELQYEAWVVENDQLVRLSAAKQKHRHFIFRPQEQGEVALPAPSKFLTTWRRFRRPIRILLWIIVTFLVLRIFFFQVARIHTPSMHQTLIEGDYVLVNKFAYGARIPITPFYVNWLQLPYMRTPGYTSVQHNDVIVFNFPGADPKIPIDQREEYIKRCVGLPGDSIALSGGDVFVNGKQLEEPAGVLQRFGLTTGYGFPDSSVMRQIDICPRAARGGYGGLLVLVSEHNADSLRKVKNITYVKRLVTDSMYYTPAVFPHNAQVKWNQDFFGPLYVPKKGQRITLNERNILLYRKIIEQHEGNTLTVKNHTIYINGQPATTYTFMMDYYFVLGDNRYDSIDSRYWGFVPEDHLIGKASFIISAAQKAPLQPQGRSWTSIR